MADHTSHFGKTKDATIAFRYESGMVRHAGTRFAPSQLLAKTTTVNVEMTTGIFTVQSDRSIMRAQMYLDAFLI